MWWVTRPKQSEGRTVVQPRTPFPRALSLNPLLEYLLQIPWHLSAVCRSALPDGHWARPEFLLTRAWKSQQEIKKEQFGFYITRLRSIPACLSVYEVCSFHIKGSETRLSECLGGTLCSVVQATRLFVSKRFDTRNRRSFLSENKNTIGDFIFGESRTFRSFARADVFVWHCISLYILSREH